VHDVKRAGEFVLVNRRRSVEPEQELDVEPRVAVRDNFRLSEGRIGLKGLVVAEQEVAHERREIDVFGRGTLIQRSEGDVGELRK
jgi:hypothetical protein